MGPHRGAWPSVPASDTFRVEVRMNEIKSRRKVTRTLSVREERERAFWRAYVALSVEVWRYLKRAAEAPKGEPGNL